MNWNSFGINEFDNFEELFALNNALITVGGCSEAMQLKTGHSGNNGIGENGSKGQSLPALFGE